MSGHSKWSSIKHKKGVKDQRRGALFSKLTRLISVAARGGADLEANFKLRLAVDKAKSSGVPKDNIERAIAKGSGQGAEGEGLEELTYEVYGPEGVALIVECVTDNTNRALAELKGVLTKNGGKLAESGSVSYQFERKGVIFVSITQSKAKIAKETDELELDIIEIGAEDIKNIDDEVFETIVAPHELDSCRQSLENKGFVLENAEVQLVSKTAINIEEKEKTNKLVSALEELNDVIDVFTNLE